MSWVHKIAVMAAAAFVGLASNAAHATLMDNGATAAVNYIGPNTADITPMDIAGVGGAYTVGTGITFDPTFPADSTIFVGPSQIIITNAPPSQVPFCFSATGATCNDQSDLFQFLFTSTPPVSGVNTADIVGVSVDPSSSPDFLPVSPLSLISPTEFTVNVENLNPAIGSQLVIDLTFASAGTGTGGNTNAPEPGSVTLLLSAALGLLTLRRIRSV